MYHSAVLPWMEIGAELLGAEGAWSLGGLIDAELPASEAGTCVMFPQTGQRAIFPACSGATRRARPHPPQGISSKSVMGISLLERGLGSGRVFVDGLFL